MFFVKYICLIVVWLTVLIEMKMIYNLHNYCESKDKTRSTDDYELSLSKSDTVNTFLSIIAFLSLAIATYSTTLLIYAYDQSIYCDHMDFSYKAYIYIAHI